ESPNHIKRPPRLSIATKPRDATPSQAERRITRRLTDALALVDIRVLDHFVVSFEDVVSFAERGWI
ncbi:JAB domain-containing protein, partial [Vibrio crassostreae]